ncbi:MAG: hypothetical protein AAF720_02125 [Pseudomonadota bacterium]
MHVSLVAGFRQLHFALPIALTLLSFGFMSSPAMAEDDRNRFAVGVYGGTLGIGGDVQARATDWLVFRAGGHVFDLNIDEEYDDIDYDANVNLSNAFLTADFHPFENGFLLSTGLIIGPKTISLSATPTETIQIGDEEFTPAEVGTLTGEVSARGAAPFLGLGFDNAVTRGSRVGISFLLGVGFTGAPEAELLAEGGILENDEDFLTQLEIEVENLEDDVDNFRFFPVARLGITVGF